MNVSIVATMETEIRTVKEEMTKQLQEAETVLELEKQKLLKVNNLIVYSCS